MTTDTLGEMLSHYAAVTLQEQNVGDKDGDERIPDV